MISPLILPARDYGTFSRDLVVIPIGAQANAEAGIVAAVVQTGVRSISPLFLPFQSRTFAVKGVGESEIVLTGASILAQGEELEGSNVVIYLEGAAISVAAGLMPTEEVAIGSGSWDDIYWIDPNRKKERKNVVTRSQALDDVDS